PDDALKSVTLYPAQILGLADQVGTLEPGKLANVIVTNGDPLELTTEVKYLFIRGQLTSTDNRHKRLFERYSGRPKPWPRRRREKQERNLGVWGNFSGDCAFVMVTRMRLPTRHSVILLASICAGAWVCPAQDANRIVDQYVKAIGGSAKLAKIRTLSMEGTFTRTSDGGTGAFTLDI